MQSIANNRKSINYTHKCVDIAKLAKNKRLLSELFGNLSALYMEMGDKEKAKIFIQKSNRLIPHADNRLLLVAQNLARDARQAMVKGMSKEVINQYKRALKIADKIQDDGLRTVCHFDLAICYQQMQNLRLAEFHALKVVEIAQSVATPDIMKSKARAETLLSRIYSGQNDFIRAKKHLDEAIRLSQLLGDESEVLASLLGLAEILRKHGAVEGSKEYYLNALFLAQKTGNQPLEFVCCFWIGKLDLELAIVNPTHSHSIKQRADRNFARAVEIASEVGQEDAKAESLYFWAQFCIMADELAKAEAFLAEAMRIFKSHNRVDFYDSCRTKLQKIRSSRSSRTRTSYRKFLAEALEENHIYPESKR